MTEKSKEVSISNDLVFKDIKPDTPISNVGQDLFGWSDPAKRYADFLEQYAVSGSRALGIWGDWGSGKTSFKNLVLEELRERNSSTIIAEFNPWGLLDLNRVREEFFRILANSAELSVEQGGAEVKGDILSFSELIAASGYSLVMLEALQHSSSSAVVAAAASSYISKLVDIIKGRSERKRKQSIDFHTLKKSIISKLSQRTKRIIYVIDDLDRLSAVEVRFVLELIRVNGDFPNITYVILGQRSSIEKAVADLDPQQDGAHYLEKIFFHGIDVPAPSSEQLSELCDAELESLLRSYEINDSLDAKRWGWFVYRHGKSAFTNLRTIRRFIASVAFKVAALKRGKLEVDLTDLVLLELFSVIAPRVWSSVAKLPTIITDDFRMTREETLENDCAELEGAIQSAPVELRRVVRAILEDVFPPAKDALEKKEYRYSDSEKDRANLRIYTEPNFYKYLRFGLAEFDLNLSELTALISTEERSIFRGMWKEFLDRGALKQLLHFLQNKELTISPDVVFLVIECLADEKITPDDLLSSRWRDGDTLKLFWLAQELLGSISDFQVRKRILIKLVNESEYPIRLSRLLFNLLANAEKPTDDMPAILEPADIIEAINLFSDSISEKHSLLRQYIMEGHAFQVTGMIGWLGRLGIIKPKEFISELADNFILKMKILSALRTGQRMPAPADDEMEVKTEYERKELEKFFDIEKLVPQIEKQDLSSLSVEEKKDFNDFLKIANFKPIEMH